MDFRMLNGKPKVTAIQRLNHTAVLIGPEPNRRREFSNLGELKIYVHRRGLEVNVEHIHPGQGEI